VAIPCLDFPPNEERANSEFWMTQITRGKRENMAAGRKGEKNEGEKVGNALQSEKGGKNWDLTRDRGPADNKWNR